MDGDFFGGRFLSYVWDSHLRPSRIDLEVPGSLNTLEHRYGYDYDTLSGHLQTVQRGAAGSNPQFVYNYLAESSCSTSPTRQEETR